MAESKIKGFPIQYIDKAFSPVNIPSESYYVDLSSQRPAAPSGYQFAFALLYKGSYTGVSTDDVPILEADGGILTGTPGKRYSSLTIRYFYTLL